MSIFASIDIGTHTARLLVAEKTPSQGLIRPLTRQRAYIRLGDGFENGGSGMISPGAVERTLKVLGVFADISEKFHVDRVFAVTTGVVRKAANRDDFLNLIYEQTGIRATVITGEQEAEFTGKGVLHSLNISGRPSMIFDLGGGSTEFLFHNSGVKVVKSLPLGAMILTQKFFRFDPPGERALTSLSNYILEAIEHAFANDKIPGENVLLVGTGGTVTTLAAMIYGMQEKDITPERVDGVRLKRGPLEDLFARMKTMTIEERMKLPGLDRDRAGVLPAGAMVVLGLLYYFKASQMVVCLSDLLEGILITHLEEGEGDDGE